MNSITRGNIKMAIKSVRSAKWRSFLTMLGIIIAVVSVITVVSIGEGIKHQVSAQINQLGRDLITVRPGQLIKRNSGIDIFSNINDFGSLSPTDLQTVQQSSGVKLAAPLGITSGIVQVSGQTPNSDPVIATTSDLPAVLQQNVDYGGFFDQDLGNQPYAAALGAGAAETLFHQQVPLGRVFDYLGQSFIVRGIFAQFDTDPLSLSTDFNNAIFIPYQTAQSLTGNNTQMFEVLAKPNDPAQTTKVVSNINSNLLNAHQNQQKFTVLRQGESLTVTNHILDLLTRLVVGIAGISLLVGGIGIMDVMLVSVTERMHEIGLRKALGASNYQILNQFLIEATVLSLIGGIIGIIAAFIVDLSLFSFTSLTPVITWQVVVITTGISVLVGIIFGSMPALKAARKNPIDALRNE